MNLQLRTYIWSITFCLPIDWPLVRIHHLHQGLFPILHLHLQNLQGTPPLMVLLHHSPARKGARHPPHQFPLVHTSISHDVIIQDLPLIPLRLLQSVASGMVGWWSQLYTLAFSATFLLFIFSLLSFPFFSFFLFPFFSFFFFRDSLLITLKKTFLLHYQVFSALLSIHMQWCVIMAIVYYGWLFLCFR